MLEGWPEKIRMAQSQPMYAIRGVTYARIRFGQEDDDWGSARGPCHDCAAIAGEFHVSGCDVERCPACRGQAISCECEDDEPEG